VVGWGIEGWVLWVWGRGLSPANFSGNSQSDVLEHGSTPTSSWLQSGSVELISEKTRLEANWFGRTASLREMLANVITLFASSYWLKTISPCPHPRFNRCN
jgi:hypothetical protein